MDYNLEKFDFNLEILKKIIKSNILLYCVVLLLTLKIATVAISINFPQNIFFADITKSVLENMVNQTRQSAGLPVLTENQKLNQAAQLKAENMVQNQYFSHISPTGITPWYWFSKAGYSYKYAGENLAIGFFESQEVFNAWLDSPSHKANILNPNYKEVGTAVLGGFGSNNTIIVVQEFASQLPAKAVAVKDNNPKPAVTTVEPKENLPIETVAPTSADGTVPVADTGERVLSQTIESQSSLGAPKAGFANNLYLRLLNFVAYNFNNFLQDIIYGVSLVVIGILLVMIFFNANGTNFERKLVFRSVLIIILLSLATALNKELIILIIPHQVTVL